jgi:hypothetical protein
MCRKEVSPFKPNFSKDRVAAIQSLVDARRTNREIKTDVSYLGGISSWFGNRETTLKNLVGNGTSLNTLKVNGYLPEDFIEHHISWKKLCGIYTTDALLSFGFGFYHMIVMGFCPEDFKRFSWEQLYSALNIRATDMLKTSITVRQLSELNLPIQQVKQLGFTWNDLVSMDGNVKTLRLLTDNLSDLKTYFNPNIQNWDEAGFSRERIALYKWKTDDFAPVRQKRAINLRTSHTIQF